ncbi:hypothetical protein [Ammoniphilus sp. YIM 78166]|nr:hypothetical protein [Ammoniphilus sp. YIM 78166]
MEQKKVKTQGTLQEMAQMAGVDQQTIQEAIDKVEQVAQIDVEVPEDK